MLEIPTDGQLAQFRSLFERSPLDSGNGRFCRLEIPTDGQLANFDFICPKFQRMANWPISILYARHSNGWPTRQFRFYMPEIATDGQLASFDFICPKFPRMANWPSFDFLIETGPVGHPWEFRARKSAKPAIDSSRKKHIAHCESRGHFLPSPGGKSATVLRDPLSISSAFLAILIVALSNEIPGLLCVSLTWVLLLDHACLIAFFVCRAFRMAILKPIRFICTLKT